MTLAECPKCHKPVQPHRACRSCGFYQGREVVDTSKKVARVLKKTQARRAPAAAEAHAGHDHDHDHDHKEEKPKE